MRFYSKILTKGKNIIITFGLDELHLNEQL